MNKTSKYGLVIGAKSMLPGNRKCSMTVTLHDVIDGHQAIYSNKERKMGHPILQLQSATKLLRHCIYIG